MLQTKPSICVLLKRSMRATMRIATTPRLKFAAFLLGSNFIVGYGGIAIFAAIAQSTKNAHWLWAGTACYIFSWIMLLAGTLLAGTCHKRFSVANKRCWRAWRKLRNCATMAIILIALTGCFGGIMPPERPLAYTVPSLMPMSALSSYYARKTTAEQVQNLMHNYGLDNVLTAYGFIPEDYTTLARGLSSRGYAEIDARKCQKCPLRWMYIGYSRDNISICILFQGPRPEQCTTKDVRFGSKGEIYINADYNSYL